MDRQVQQIFPEPQSDEERSRRWFSEFSGHANIVLLGDPGAGKTHLFKAFARERGGNYLPVRAFLCRPIVSFQQANALYLDALDETRSGRGDRDTVDRVVKQLWRIQPAQVRLSCRHGDWLAGSDLQVFRDYFDVHGDCVVLALRPLDHAEQCAILQAHEIDDPTAFISRARASRCDVWLGNPQNLIMLADVICNDGGRWPATRDDLYQRATALLLREPNTEHKNIPGGVFGPEELRAAAGAIAAAVLIGGVQGISSIANGDEDYPSCRSLKKFDAGNPTCALEQVEAALKRRLFVGVPGTDYVEFAHRTLAEYLAAQWLAERIRQGLPLGRVEVLLCCNGQVVSSLRGLHAWLAVRLFEQTNSLIDADPYGILTYGDVSALTGTQRKRVLSALAKLAEENPWFRRDYGQVSNFGGLVSPDIVEEFRAVLTNASTNFALRSIVLDALAAGTPQPALIPELSAIIVGSDEPYAPREAAVEALMNMGQLGRVAIQSCYGNLSDKADDMRLRAEIICALYGAHFSFQDVVALLNTAVISSNRPTTGSFWCLSDVVTDQELWPVLSQITAVNPETSGSRYKPGAAEVLLVFDRLLLRALNSEQDLAAAQLQPVLMLRSGLAGNVSRSQDQAIREALLRRPAALAELVHLAITNAEAGEYDGRFIGTLNVMTFNVLDQDELLERLANYVMASTSDDAKLMGLFKTAILQSFRATPLAITVFDRLYEWGLHHPAYFAELERCCVCVLNVWDIERAVDSAGRRQTIERERARRLKKFASDQVMIQLGQHSGWLIWIASVYLDRDHRLDGGLSPAARLASEIGEFNTKVALEGLLAAARLSALPKLQAIADASGTYDSLWDVAIAAVTEHHVRGYSLAALSDDILKAALAADAKMPTYFREGNHSTAIAHPWIEALLAHRPALVKDVYWTLALADLQRNAPYTPELDKFFAYAALAQYREEVILYALEKFPNANPTVLAQLLSRGLADVERTQLQNVVRTVLARTDAIDDPSCGYWLAAAYLLMPDDYRAFLSDYISRYPEAVWILRDFCRDSDEPQHRMRQLGVEQYAYIVGLFGHRYQYCENHPSSWTGNRHPWDATNFVRSLINGVAADASPAATAVLIGLRDDAELSSYRDLIKHALAEQRVRRADTAYQSPGWEGAISVLANAVPANTADLHALVFAHLNDLKKEILTRNTDPYRQFWNEGGNGTASTPRIEDRCRDLLIDLLQPRLSPLAIRVEPEGHMAHDKRADIVITRPEMKLVIELKRNYHEAVWTAMNDQLEGYAQDPEAGEYGIYGVFWFGAGTWPAMPLPPGKGSRPVSADEMADALNAQISASRRARLVAVVLDLCGPSAGSSNTPKPVARTPRKGKLPKSI